MSLMYYSILLVAGLAAQSAIAADAEKWEASRAAVLFDMPHR